MVWDVDLPERGGVIGPGGGSSCAGHIVVDVDA